MNLEAEKVRKIEFSKESGCNTTDAVILEHVRQNIRRGLPQVQPHVPNPAMALLVCGGPSLAMTEKELVEAYWAGGKVIACNGAYQWCIDRNIKPSAAVMLDARDFNARFIKTPVEGCKYLLASQCHPSTFDMCRDRIVHIWHACTAGEPELDVLKEYYFEPKVTPESGLRRTFPVQLGTTVGVRAISLLRMLGFQNMEIFGLDSCWLGDEHHAYEQVENKDLKIGVWLRPKGRDDKAQRFLCAPWHMKQYEDFLGLVKARGNLFQLNVHGPGLIATALRTGAELQLEEVPAQRSA